MVELYRVAACGVEVPQELRTLLDGVETATIGHFDPIGVLRGALRPVFPARIVGAALTVAAPGRDGAVIYKAVDLVRPGDVLVISRVDADDVACVGGGVASAVKARGGVGIVVDGPATDPQEIREVGLPVWSVGVSARTTNRQYQIGGAVNLPIACGGVAVLPGYVVLADETGIYAAEAEQMRLAAIHARERQARSALLRAHLAAGHSIFDFVMPEQS